MVARLATVLSFLSLSGHHHPMGERQTIDIKTQSQSSEIINTTLLNHHIPELND